MQLLWWKLFSVFYSVIHVLIFSRWSIYRLGSHNNQLVPVDKLSDYEMMIAAHLVDPNDIKVSWNDIAGLSGLIDELRETVILPIQRRDLFLDSHLTSPPKGKILIYNVNVQKLVLIISTSPKKDWTCLKKFSLQNLS